VPGSGVHSYLGHGVYAAHVCADPRRNVQAAFDSARAFARLKSHDQISCLWLRVCVDRGLHLQNPQIKAAFTKARQVIAQRLASCNVVFEPRTDSFRPFDHVAVEMFRLIVEVISDWEIDVLSAEFRPSEGIDDSIPKIIAPELCIKRPRAILGIAKAFSCTDVPDSHDRPEDWPIRNDVREAANDVARFIEEMTTEDFFDLYWKTIEGSQAEWPKPSPRFSQGNSIALITGTPTSGRWRAFCKVLETKSFGDRRIEFRDLNTIRHQPCPLNVAKIDELLRDSTALVLFAPAWEPDLIDIVLRAVDLGRPVLSVAKEGAQFPSRLRFARNTARIDLDRAVLDFGRLAQMLEGFTKDRWKDSWEKHAVRMALAARQGGSFADDAETIMAAHAERNPSERLPGFNSGPQRDLLSGLPDSASNAARELRSRLGVRSAAIEMSAMERAVDEVYQLDIGAAGYFLRPGLLGPHRIVVLRKRDRLTRRRFTFAHEIAHAVRQGMRQLDHAAEESWCDEFAEEFLMPESAVKSFGTSLEDWLRFAAVFQVSNDAASIRSWQCDRKLLLQSGQKYPKGAAPENLASELLRIATAKDMQAVTNESGRLSTGEPFLVRRWPDGHFIAVADCSKADAPKSDAILTYAP
jgi:IrrE N-terminal-like domain